MEDKTIQVYVSAEDPVTKAIVERLLAYCSTRFVVFKEIPARGGEIKNKIQELNNLAASRPVILLTDLDTEYCAPQLKSKLLKDMAQSPNFVINIAIDEAEAWLMADREGFSKYLGIPIDVIPESTMQKMGGSKPVLEMDFCYKSSLYLTHKIAPQSFNEELKQQIAVQGQACKGKEYNSAMLPFVKEVWNIEAATQNSDSLSRMIRRLCDLEQAMLQ